MDSLTHRTRKKRSLKRSWMTKADLRGRRVDVAVSDDLSICYMQV